MVHHGSLRSRPRRLRGSAAITTRRVPAVSRDTPLGIRRVPGVRARSRRPVRRAPAVTVRGKTAASKACTRARDRAGHARLRARRRAAWRGDRVLCSVACLRTSREMSLICGGRGGSRSAAGSTGREARDAKTLESEDDFPGGQSPGAWPRACTYLDIFVRPLAEELDFSDLSHGDSCPRVLRVGKRAPRPSLGP